MNAYLKPQFMFQSTLFTDLKIPYVFEIAKTQYYTSSPQ